MVLDYSNPYWKQVWTGGEKLVPLDPPTKFDFTNAYGPTECTVAVSLEKITAKEYRIPIGKPLDICSCYILNQDLKEQPYGIAGELCITGPQVARGYLNRDEETQKHFIKNPFSSDPLFKMMYKTGDVARFLPDGRLDIIGRKDSQVKIRGFRIELSEVEEIIRKYPSIVDATVIAPVDPNGGNHLAAYIVGKDEIDIGKLKEFIAKSKPPYMVPPYIMQIDKIPLNQNGKVNKKALPEIKATKNEIIAPKNEKQAKILKAVKEVVGDVEIGIEDDLFDYGLSSLGLMKFLTLLEEEFKEDFSIQEIRQARTIEKIAEISHKNIKEKFVTLQDYPLSKTQEGIFVESISNKGSTIYNVPLLQKLNPKIDVEKLKKAIIAALTNHPYLNSKLVLASSGEARMKPTDDEIVVEVIKSKDIESYYTLKPFDILKDHLYRIRIIETKDDNYLFMEFHHIIFDGASLAILYQEIQDAYLGKKLNPETKNGYQVALEEEERRTKDELSKEKNYYEALLKGISVSSTPKREFNSISKKINKTYTKKLNLPDNLDDFIKKNKLTRNSFFNSVFSLALAKWNDMDEVLYDTIYEGRDLASLSKAITMLVKTLPVYISIKEKETIKEFLNEMKEQISSSQANTLYSFGEIVHDLSFTSDVLFAYQGDGFISDEFAGLKVTNIPLVSETPKSLFGVQIVENNEGSYVNFEFDSSQYKDEMAVHFARMMETIISEFTNKKMMDEISVIDEESLKEIDKYNLTDDKPIFKNYVQAFQASVKKDPKKVAVIGIDEKLTYEELDKRSNVIANFLLSKKVKKDDKIIVMMPRIASAYVVIQGVLKSGACFAPVDPKYPDDRVNYIIETAQAPLILTTKKIKEERKNSFNSTPVYTIEEIFEKKIDASFPDVEISSDSLAYCIFTSGSTGKPKGVMIEHHSLVNYVSNTPHNLVAKEYLKYATVSLALASLSFDISVDEEMVPLANNLTVMLASEDEILNPIYLAKRMVKEGVDFIFPVPSYLNNALDIKEVAEAFKQLKLIKTGGEAFSSSLYRKIKDLGINAVLHNVYGPTEITVANCQDTIEDEDCITIGYPSANYQDYIIDKNNHLVPFGAIGEILVAGEGVSRGYIGLDDLNKERYITINGKRAFKTGDIGRFLYDGRIDIFGRKDNQVKLRGLRIELDEIEANMNKYDGIDKAICLVKENPKDGQFLVGYYTAKKEIDTEDLKKFLAKTLTPYMIPRVFVKMDAFPTNNNGKVDKKALPIPEIKASSSSSRKPKNELQEKLYDIYKKVLGIEEFSIDDDFFQLGGSSLSASKVAMLAMEENLPLTYSDVFDNPSIADLYEHIILMKSSNNETSAKVVEEVKVDKEVQKELAYNDLSHVDKIKIDHDLGRVILFGATGFLGIHVLKELLKDPKQEIVCLVRPGSSISVEARLKGLLAYYFDSPCEECFAKQIKLIQGDITSSDLQTLLKDEKFDTIINCAAIVKHFANDDSIERVNFHGVENLINLALKRSARLVQVSTLSVAGTNDNHQFPPDRKIHENEIFFGQDISNKYVNSKILAEQAISKAIADNNLKAKIVRVGNLMSRQSDGEFQINSVTNNFMNSLKAYAVLGVFPVMEASSTVDFSPIDEVAKTIVLFAKTNDEFTILHSANSHEVEMGDVIDAMNENGFDIKLVSNEEFMDKLHKEMAKGNDKVSSLIRYNVSEGTSSFILSDNKFSVQALYILGYHWPITSKSYLSKAISALVSLGFFEE